MNAKRIILFDVDGVLVNGYHFNPKLRRCWDEHMETDLGISRDLFFQKFISGVFINEVIPGKKSLINALDEVLPDLGYQGSAMTIASYWLARDSHLNQSLLSLIKQLPKDKVDLYIATNQEHMRAMHLWHTLGLGIIFRDIYYSARLGAAKPSSSFFQAVKDTQGPQEQVPLMFDDTPEVIEAARNAGWEAVLYNELTDFTQHPYIQKTLNQI